MEFKKQIVINLRQLLEPHRSVARQARVYRASQWEAPAFHEKKMEQALAHLFTHCWGNVPYYKALFLAQGFSKPGEVRLNILPELTKSMIRENFERLKSTDLRQRQWFITKSGGSTGEPVSVIQDFHYRVYSEAKKQICFEWAGYEFGDSLIKLWGAEQDILLTKKSLRSRLANLLANRVTLNSFLMSPERMRHYLAVINKTKPRCVLAYAHSIYELAKFAKLEGIPVHSPQAIITTSETLYPFMRQGIEATFQCAIFDQYGSRELSCLASECNRHEGLHVNSETVCFEVVDERGQACAPGVEGDILVTSLVNQAMPLIRYRIGDRAVWQDKACACGRGLALLQKVTGRSMDCFRRADGSIIPGEYFIHFLGVVFNEGWVKQVQVIQEEYELVRVIIVPSQGAYSQKNIDEVKNIIRLVMGESCRVDVEIATQPELTKTGKFRYTVCKLKIG